jgi:hypothetical protein
MGTMPTKGATTKGATTKGATTKQGIRDLNQYGPRRRKDALASRVEDKRAPSSVGPSEKRAAR